MPAVLNTSFNDREPVVETPAHALATFQDSGCVLRFRDTWPRSRHACAHGRRRR